MGISRDSRHKRRNTGGKRISIKKKRKYDFGRQPTFTKIGEKRVRVVRTRGGHYKVRALRLETGNFSWATEAIARKSRIIQVVYNSTNNELVRTNTLVKGSIVTIDATPFRQWYFTRYGVDLAAEDPMKVAILPKDQVPKPNPPREKKPPKVKKEKGAGDKKVKDKKDPKAKKDPKVKRDLKAKKDLKEKKDLKDKQEKKKIKKEIAKPKSSSKTKEEEKKEDVIKPISAASLARRRSRYQGIPKVEQGLVEQIRSGKLFASIASSPGQVGRADGYLLEGEELAFYSKKLVVKKKK
eukprot:TRINITY_DN1032_c0_g1_i1.p1 TRINITY_DN1032_c0_g1~~TRINITY_DN1032_c0_g1_i1.p1  ORF type:complete len:296 (+),score=90.56 TRINITY_DN1032_c0_g1_i1:133-1020(+)